MRIFTNSIGHRDYQTCHQQKAGFVIGAAGGIGRATAIAFAKEGLN